MDEDWKKNAAAMVEQGCVIVDGKWMCPDDDWEADREEE